MSSLKTIQDEIEKALAANLMTRFNNAEFEENAFDQRDLAMFSQNETRELYLRLFIRSRQGDLEKAYKTMIDSLRWRKEYGIRDITNECFNTQTVDAVIKEGLLFYHNTDKKKKPILIFQGNKYKYKKDERKEQELAKLFAYLIEKQHQKHFGQQILVICDHQDATLEHIDLKFFKFIVDLFNTYYPNILAAWRNIKKWLSPDTSTKFKFVTKTELTDYVDRSNLLVSLGGTDKYEYVYPPNEETQNPFEPLQFDEEISKMHGHSRFVDAIAIDQGDDVNETEMAKDSISAKINMGNSGTALRKRSSRPYQNTSQSSSEEIVPPEEEIRNEIIISPSDEITFQERENVNEVYETLTLKNVCDNKVIFKIKTNSAANFRVKPRVGALEAGAKRKIVVMLLIREEASNDKRHWEKDKFLIQYAQQHDAISNETNIFDLWKSIPKLDIKEHRLKCRVLDVNGLEKRPKKIEDAIEMNLRLQEQLSQLQNKMEKFKDPLEAIQEQLFQQRIFLFAISGVFVVLLLLMYFMR